MKTKSKKSQAPPAKISRRKSKSIVKSEVAAGAAEASDSGAAAVEETPCVEEGVVVDSPQSSETTAAQNALPEPTTLRSTTMNIKLIPHPKARKDDRLVIFDIEGRVGQVQCLKTLFGDNVPGELTLSGDSIAEAKVKVAKEKETPEARKARLAALPKLTPAEKLARAEERVAKLKAKLAVA